MWPNTGLCLASLAAVCAMTEWWPGALCLGVGIFHPSAGFDTETHKPQQSSYKTQEVEMSLHSQVAQKMKKNRKGYMKFILSNL